jgi:hypothetical protein
VEDWPRSTFADVSDTCCREKTRQPPPTHTRTLSLSLSLSLRLPPSLSLSADIQSLSPSLEAEKPLGFSYSCVRYIPSSFFFACVCVCCNRISSCCYNGGGRSDVGEDREFFKARASEEKIFFVHFIVRERRAGRN